MRTKITTACLLAVSIFLMQSDTIYAKCVLRNTPISSTLTSKLKHELSSTNDSTLKVIRKSLNRIFADELNRISKEDKVFTYSNIDLNDDGQPEILVGLMSSYFCGSGGCTAYLLSNEGILISKFTVSDYPFLVSPLRSLGWNNLITRSGGHYRTLQWNGRKYPSNPSMEKKSQDAEVKDKRCIKLFSFAAGERHQF